MKKNVLVTGGAGFIGHYLNKILLERGYSVTVLDDLSTGQARNLDAYKDHPDFEYHIDTFMNDDSLYTDATLS